jgi:chemotaxis protein CheC
MAQVENLNEVQLDALQEIVNIGCSHAATAVSQMINQEVNISVPIITVKRIQELYDTLLNVAGENAKIVGVYLELTEEFLASILFLFPYDSALILSDLLLGNEIGTTREIDEMGQSAIKEVGNIVVSAYTNALGQLLECTVMLSPPTFSMDFPKAYVDKIENNITNNSTHALMFDTLFKGRDDLFKSYFFLIPSNHSLDVLLEKLAMRLSGSMDQNVNDYVDTLACNGG